MIGTVVLAAGSSTRMGHQKLLLPYAGRPLIRHVVKAVLEGPATETVVVTGHSRSEVERALAGLPVTFAHNAGYENGMLSSVRTGVQALAKGLSPMIVLGDQPVVPVCVLRALAERLETEPNAIVVPVYERRRGHPMAFGACYRDEVHSRYDDIGLRGLLQSHPEAVIEITVDHGGILEDVDTPADYTAALDALRRDSDDFRT